MNLTTSRGAAMAVTLVLLTGVTLLALVALQRSTLQTKMVANYQIEQATHDFAMNEVESIFEAIASANSNNQLVLNALNSVQMDGDEAARDEDGRPIMLPVTIGAQSDYGRPEISVATTLQYTGSPTNLNWTLAGDNSSGEFSEYQFEIKSAATAPSGVSSRQTFGLIYRVTN